MHKGGDGMRKPVLHCAALAMALFILIALALANSENARWPAEPNTRSLKSNGKLQVDAANVSEGYFQARLSSSSKRKMKLRVVKGGTTLTYNLNTNGDFEIFPLQLGSGSYDILLYENVSGSKYSSAGKISLSVKLSDEDVCFLYPNQYVNYTQLTEAVKQADIVCEGLAGEEAYQAVCKYMKTHFGYDYIKALTIKAGVLPDIDGAWAKNLGICQDLSAITCCMLRTQGVTAKMMIGYADKNYHAWVTAIIDGKEYFFDPTAAVNAISGVKAYSVERFY